MVQRRLGATVPGSRGDFAGAEQFERAAAGVPGGLQQSSRPTPYRWTYTGQPLVQGTPFSRDSTRRQQRQGRAWFRRTAASGFDRYLYPPPAPTNAAASLDWRMTYEIDI